MQRYQALHSEPARGHCSVNVLSVCRLHTLVRAPCATQGFRPAHVECWQCYRGPASIMPSSSLSRSDDAAVPYVRTHTAIVHPSRDCKVLWSATESCCVSRFVSLQHVQQAWQQAQPVAAALLAAYPQFLRAEHFDHDSYMWAVQLWYAYSMQVCSGTPTPCRQQRPPLLQHALRNIPSLIFPSSHHRCGHR